MTIHDQWAALYTAGRVRWMPGMMDAGGRRVINAGADKDGRWARFAITGEWIVVGNDLHAIAPDFTDPATIGCLLHQAREAWDADSVNTHVVRHHMLPGGEKWVILIDGFQPGIEGPTRIDAILAAIAAAPPKVKE
jgi:hypothetical protein